MANDQVRAAIYARVSSDQQADAGTVRSQVDALLKRAQDDGVTIDEEMKFVDDGYSGAVLLRPALERLRDLAFAGAMDRLYVYRPDRLARKYAYQVLLVEELQRCGVELIFLNHALGRTPEEDLLLQVQGMVAEYERAQILERSRRGKRHAAHRGSANVLAGAPYGYRYVTKHEGSGEAHYHVILPEAQVVQQIFQWIGRDRLSIGAVCERLDQQGIPTRTGKSRWNRTTVYGMLRNPAYKGTAAFGKTRSGALQPPLRPRRNRTEHSRRACTISEVPQDEWIHVPVPAIIDEALFEAAAEQLAENRRRYRQRRRGARHLLQGLLVCEGCGYALSAASVGRSGPYPYSYYRCTGMEGRRFGGQRLCGNTPLRSDMLEDAVWADVCSLLADPQRVEQEYERRLANKTDAGFGQSIEQMQRQIGKVKRGMSRIADAYEDGWLEKAEFEQRMGRARDQLNRLQAQVQAMSDEESQRREMRLVIGQLGAFAHRVAEGLESADWKTRREIICALVKEIRVGMESLRIVYRVTPPPSGSALARTSASAGSPANSPPERPGDLRHCSRGVRSCAPGSRRSAAPRPGAPRASNPIPTSRRCATWSRASPAAGVSTRPTRSHTAP